MGRGSNRIGLYRIVYMIVWYSIKSIAFVRVPGDGGGTGMEGGLRVPHNNCQQIYEHVKLGNVEAQDRKPCL